MHWWQLRSVWIYSVHWLQQLRAMSWGLLQMDHPVVWCKALHSLDTLSLRPSLDMMRAWSVWEVPRRACFCCGLVSQLATSSSLAIYSGFLIPFKDIRRYSTVVSIPVSEPFPLDFEPAWNTWKMPRWTSKQSHKYVICLFPRNVDQDIRALSIIKRMPSPDSLYVKVG